MIVDFTGLKLNDLTPIYLQIIRFVKVEIISGRVKEGDEMPSRRLLSAALGINPNTIQKAYKELEEENILISYAGAKSIITLDNNKAFELKKEFIYKETESYIDLVKSMGMEITEVKEILDSLWKLPPMEGER